MLKPLLKNDYTSLIKISFFAIFESFFSGSPYFILILILNDILQNNFTKSKMFFYILTLFILFSIRVFFSLKAYKLGMKFGFKKSLDLRVSIASHLKDISMSNFSKKDVGLISKIVLEDVNNVENIFTHLYVSILTTFILTIFILLVLIYMNTILGLIFLAILFLCLPFFILSKKSLEKRAKKRVLSSSNLSTSIIEYLKGVKELKLFNKEGKNFTNIDKHLKEYENASLDIEKKSIFSLMFVLSFLEVSLLCLIAFSCYMLKIQEVDAYIVISFLIISMRFFSLIKVFLANYGALKIMKESGKNIVELLALEKIAFEKDLKINSYCIEFKNSSFSYENKIVLKNLNFTIEENSFIALVGASGEGKSTIINLILRYWDCTKGEIFFGDINIKRLNPDYLMAYISMVFQDVYLFEGSIYENISIAKENTSLDEVIEICKKAQCHDFIMKLKDGYETKIKHSGSNLSGGEKQRLSIARAMLKDSKIIIFDEATSSLDAFNERAVQKAIDELIKTKTVIVIAHKLSSIQHADKIFVLNNQGIEQEGKHENLLNEDGIYKELWQYQLNNTNWKIN